MGKNLLSHVEKRFFMHWHDFPMRPIFFRVKRSKRMPKAESPCYMMIVLDDRHAKKKVNAFTQIITPR